MARHELKIWHEEFKAILEGRLKVMTVASGTVAKHDEVDLLEVGGTGANETGRSAEYVVGQVTELGGRYNLASFDLLPMVREL